MQRRVLTIGGRVLLFLFPLLAGAQGWQAGQLELFGSPESPACQAAGQITSLDRIAHSLTLRSDGGDRTLWNYRDSTIFLRSDGVIQPFRGDAVVQPAELAIGDRLCVQSHDPERIVGRVLVTFRPDIQSRNKMELLVWQRRTFFGPITAIERQRDGIWLTISDATRSARILIDARSEGPLHAQTGSNGEIIDFHQMTLDDLACNQALYVMSREDTGSQPLRADLVFTGGLRSFVGTISSMDTSSGFLTIRDFFSKQTTNLRFDFSRIRRSNWGSPNPLFGAGQLPGNG
jgi:hypothetical protein